MDDQYTKLIVEQLHVRNYSYVSKKRVNFFQCHDNRFDGFWVDAIHMETLQQECLLVVFGNDIFYVEKITAGDSI